MIAATIAATTSATVSPSTRTLTGTCGLAVTGALFRYDGQKLKEREPIACLRGKNVSAIAQDREGQFLFGYWENDHKPISGLYTSPLKIVYQQGEQFQTIFVEDDKKTPYSRIGRVIATRNNEIYFHLTSSDFLASDTGFVRWHPEEGLTFYGTADGLIDNNITDLLLDRDENLWIATANGLSHFDGSTFRTFTTEDGLPSNRTHCLFEDARGHLWIGTDRAVAQYDGRLFPDYQVTPHRTGLSNTRRSRWEPSGLARSRVPLYATDPGKRRL